MSAVKGQPFCLGSGELALEQPSGVTATSRNVVVANSQILVPPYRRPYWIKELRFVLKSNGMNSYNNTAPNPHYDVVDQQMFYQVKLSLGTHALTYSFLPICLLAPSVQLAAEEAPGVDNDTYQVYSFSYIRWVLPKPMFVPAGNGILAMFQRITDNLASSEYGDAPGSVEIAVVGETLGDGAQAPKTSCIPYVQAHNNSSTPAVTANNQVLLSTPAGITQAHTIQNPFNDRPLHMQRFIGRYYRQITSQGLTNQWWQANLSGTSTNDALVRLTDSDRYPISPADGIRFGELFDCRTHALEHRAIIPPLGYIQASFQNASNNATDANYPSYWVSAIAWREEAIS